MNLGCVTGFLILMKFPFKTLQALKIISFIACVCTTISGVQKSHISNLILPHSRRSFHEDFQFNFSCYFQRYPKSHRNRYNGRYYILENYLLRFGLFLPNRDGHLPSPKYNRQPGKF